MTHPTPDAPETKAGAKAAEAKADAAAVKADAKAEAAETKSRKNLAPASQSGDPDVHRLLAERQSHLMNQTPDPSYEARRDGSQAAIDAIDKALADLGYTAQ